jgi:choline dehydrogenase
MLFQAILVSLALQASSVTADNFERRAAPLSGHTFDYVVVGGGTGGIALATRLAQNDFKVALIEAGGYYELESLAEVPAADVLPVGSDPNAKSPEDWGFVTRDQPGANGRAIHYARGKCLGGS